MKRTLIALIIVSLLTGLNLLPAIQAQDIRPESGPPAPRSSPILFIENVGQFPEGARFLVRGVSGDIWLADDAIWLTVLERQPQTVDHSLQAAGGRLQRVDLQPRRAINLKLSFVGANAHPRLEPFGRLDTRVNYYLGNDPDKWYPDVPVWSGVRYLDLYPGIDLEIMGANGQWAWRLTGETHSPSLSLPGGGSESGGIHLRVEGAEALELDGDYLRVTATVGEFHLPLLTLADSRLDSQPARVERLNRQTFAVTSPFALASSSAVVPAVAQDAPANLLFSSYLGGSGYDQGEAIAVEGIDALEGREGAVYVTGSTASSDFPGATGQTLAGTFDAFVTKLKRVATLVVPVYVTFIGGSYTSSSYPGLIDESGLDLAIDKSGNAYVTGWTFSDDFPTTAGAFDRTYNGPTDSPDVSPPRHCMDAFVVKLNSTGQLAYSTYLGGSGFTIPGYGRGGGEDAGGGIAVDANGIIYVTGFTESEDFPTTSGAYDRVYANVDVGLNDDVFVAKLNPAGQGTADLLYSTYVGGGCEEAGYDLALDGAGNAYVTGYARGDIFPVNSDFPITSGAVDTYLWTRDHDAFVFKLQPAGQGLADLVYSTFLGGTDWDEGHAITVDAAGVAYITGLTASGNFTITSGAYDTTCGADGTCSNGYSRDAFLARINPNPAGSAQANLLYSTYLGGSNDENDVADLGDIALDATGDVYVTGLTYSDDFPITSGAIYTARQGSYDIYVSRLRLQGQGAADLVYSTYLGGGGGDVGLGLAVDSQGMVYVTGCTRSANFPTTSRASDWTLDGSTEGFVVKLRPSNPTTSDVDAYVQAPALVGGPPASVAAIPIQYGNHGAMTATTVILTATLGISLTYTGDTSGVTPTVTSDTITTVRWDLSDLAFYGDGQFDLQVRLPDVSFGTRYPVTLTLTSAGPEAIPGNNTASLEVMVARQVFLPLVLRTS